MVRADFIPGEDTIFYGDCTDMTAGDAAGCVAGNLERAVSGRVCGTGQTAVRILASGLGE